MHATEQKLERILADLYALDEGLKTRDNEVRMLVSTLLEARPSVVPDATYLAELRARVVALASAPLVVPVTTQTVETHDWFWWTLRAVPVGVLAVLTLALVGSRPQIPHSPEFESGGMPIQPSTPSMSAPASPPAGETFSESAPPQRKGTGESSVDAPADTLLAPDGVNRAMITDETQMQTTIGGGNAFYIPAQAPGNEVVVSFISLDTPAFVEVFTYENEKPKTFLGVSALIPVGTSYDVSVPLSRQSRHGEMLYARLRADNGDEVFDRETDVALTDTQGSPMFTFFVVDAEATQPSAVIQ